MIKDEYLKNHQTKDWREPYRHAKAVSPACRNHGNCPWCACGRKTKNKRLKQRMDYREKEGLEELAE